MALQWCWSVHFRTLLICCVVALRICKAADPAYEIHALIHANHSEGGALYFVDSDSTGSQFYFSDPSAHVLRVGSVHKGVAVLAAGVPHQSGHADGAATKALLTRPRGLCQAPDGSLLVLDSGNRAIRHVKNGIVTTVVSNGTHDCVDGGSDVATISAGAWDVLCLEDGSMVYTDTECSKVRLVKCVKHCPVPVAGEGALMRALAELAGTKTPEYMITTLVAGNHAEGGLFYQLARDNVTDHTGRFYYVSDFRTHVVRVVDTKAGTAKVLFGVPHITGYQNGVGHRALLHTPRGLCQAPDGSVFVLDSGNQAVRRYKDGVVTTVIGNGTHVSGCVDGGPGEGSISNGAWGLICLPDGSMVYTDPDCSTLRLLKCISNCPVHDHTTSGTWNWWEAAVGALVSFVVVGAGSFSAFKFNQRGLVAIESTRAQHLTPSGSAPTLDDIEAPLLLSHSLVPVEEGHEDADPFHPNPEPTARTTAVEDHAPTGGVDASAISAPGGTTSGAAPSTNHVLDELAAAFSDEAPLIQAHTLFESSTPSDRFATSIPPHMSHASKTTTTNTLKSVRSSDGVDASIPLDPAKASKASSQTDEGARASAPSDASMLSAPVEALKSVEGSVASRLPRRSDPFGELVEAAFTPRSSRDTE